MSAIPKPFLKAGNIEEMNGTRERHQGAGADADLNQAGDRDLRLVVPEADEEVLSMADMRISNIRLVAATTSSLEGRRDHKPGQVVEYPAPGRVPGPLGTVGVAIGNAVSEQVAVAGGCWNYRIQCKRAWAFGGHRAGGNAPSAGPLVLWTIGKRVAIAIDDIGGGMGVAGSRCEVDK